MDFEIYEVGPRDGLQSHDTITPTAVKVELIEEIAMSGIRKIEVGSLVHPEKVPNMADSDILFKQLPHLQYDCELAMLVPNKQGVERAKKIGVENFNVFFSPSESFNMNNHGKMSSQVFTEYCTSLDGIPKENIRGIPELHVRLSVCRECAAGAVGEVAAMGGFARKHNRPLRHDRLGRPDADSKHSQPDEGDGYQQRFGIAPPSRASQGTRCSTTSVLHSTWAFGSSTAASVAWADVHSYRAAVAICLLRTL